MIDDSEENEERLPEESSRKRYHDRSDDRERENESEDGGDEDEDLLKEKLYRELREREQAMREHEDSDFQDDERQQGGGGPEDEDDIPDREKSFFNDEKQVRKHYADDNDNDNDAEDEGKKRFLNRMSSKIKAVQNLQKRPSEPKEYSVTHAERLLDHLQDEAVANQKKLNFQQTSGLISNKGGISLGFMNKLNKNKQATRHQKMKRHQLFLAPHRRNFYIKNTNTSKYTTISSLLEEKSRAEKGDKSRLRTLPKAKKVADDENDPDRRELVFKTFFSSKSKPLIRRYRLYSKRDTILHPIVKHSGYNRMNYSPPSQVAFGEELSRHFDPDMIR